MAQINKKNNELAVSRNREYKSRHLLERRLPPKLRLFIALSFSSVSKPISFFFCAIDSCRQSLPDQHFFSSDFHVCDMFHSVWSCSCRALAAVSAGRRGARRTLSPLRATHLVELRRKPSPIFFRTARSQDRTYPSETPTFQMTTSLFICR